jgi:hypothetical protein
LGLVPVYEGTTDILLHIAFYSKVVHFEISENHPWSSLIRRLVTPKLCI